VKLAVSHGRRDELYLLRDVFEVKFMFGDAQKSSFSPSVPPHV